MITEINIPSAMAWKATTAKTDSMIISSTMGTASMNMALLSGVFVKSRSVPATASLISTHMDWKFKFCNFCKDD